MTQKLTRVRHTSGEFGWHNSPEGVIRADLQPDLKLMAYWLRNSQWDQEDFGLPAEGYLTAYGYWTPVER